MPVSNDLLRERLKSERDRLVSQLKQLKVDGHKNLGYSTHMADDASAAFDQARDLALRGNLEQLLRQVKGALNRFADGTYGICKTCGEQIDPARLKALPHAPHCLNCQRRLES
jgi:RNA polymerase-binding protein DksA